MSAGDDESVRLHAAVRAAIASPERADFEGLLREVLAHQAARVDAVGRLFRARAIDVGTTKIERMPGVPCDVFRLKRVAAHPSTEDVRVFRTSGTTLGLRGEHAFRDLDTYEAAAMSFARETLLADFAPGRVIALAPPSTALVDSSLSFMIDLFARELGVPIRHFVSERGLDVEGLAAEVAEARAHGAPVLFLGTAFAFVYLLDDLSIASFALPSGSRAMITGGFKGKSREVSEPELRASLAAKLALEPGAIVGEYGMTELSSQLYQRRDLPAEMGVRYTWPRWVRVVPVDPETLEPVAPGEVGIGRIIDLANIDSAAIIQTSDRVRIDAHGLELLGRAPGATPRGCSIAIEEIVAANDART